MRATDLRILFRVPADLGNRILHRPEPVPPNEKSAPHFRLSGVISAGGEFQFERRCSRAFPEIPGSLCRGNSGQGRGLRRGRAGGTAKSEDLDLGANSPGPKGFPLAGARGVERTWPTHRIDLRPGASHLSRLSFGPWRIAPPSEKQSDPGISGNALVHPFNLFWFRPSSLPDILQSNTHPPAPLWVVAQVQPSLRLEESEQRALPIGKGLDIRRVPDRFTLHFLDADHREDSRLPLSSSRSRRSAVWSSERSTGSTRQIVASTFPSAP